MSKIWVKGLVATAALVLAGAGAHGQGQVPVSAAENGNLWFVELAGAPEADGTTNAAVKAEKAAFKNAASAAGVKWKERRSYDVLFNGFSVEATPTERTKLAMLPGFKAMYPIDIIQAPRPERNGAGAAPDLAAAIGMTGASAAQAAGWTGAGVKVGIIDTGIDIDHPDFGGSGVNGSTPFPSSRVIAGYDFVGDAYNFDDSNPVPSPDNNPDDCGGHGTHVSGIVGANGTVKGVAPDVSFGAYRVFGCEGSTSSDIILAALERAYADGMQVINQSLGSARQWPQYPTAVATSRLAKKGVVVVASIGNNGPQGGSPDGLYAAGAPGVGERVIGVASYDNAQVTKPAFAATPDGRLFGYVRASEAPPSPLTGNLPMSRTGTLASTADGCAALTPGSLTGTAALIRRGTCGFAVKAQNAQAAGAAAVVLYNNQPGEVTPTVSGVPAVTIPVVMVTQADGEAMDARIAGGPTTLSWTGQTVSLPLSSGGLISGFSSFGLAADLSLKPNIGAPGGSIYSTYPLESGGYATLSGTSMSSPHVAGGAALVLQARPKTKVEEMKLLMQNTADPKNWSLNAGLGFLDHVHRQGAGMLDIAQAIATPTTVEPSEIALGESEARSKKIKLKVKNDGASPVTYALTHVAALATAPIAENVVGTFAGQFGYFLAPATVTFKKTMITVKGRSNENVDVAITAPDGFYERGIYGGYLVLTPQGGGLPLRVPFAGFMGDYQQIPVLTPTANGFPWLAQLVGGFFNNRPGGATYTLLGDDIPYFLLHFEHHSEQVLLEALDASTGKVVGRVSLDEWFTRNSTASGYFSFAWDGNVFKKDPSKPKQWSSVKNGNYKVRVSVTKALAEKKNEDHVETWTSPIITIARP
jgi:subtilisin family serine protease